MRLRRGLWAETGHGSDRFTNVCALVFVCDIPFFQLILVEIHILNCCFSNILCRYAEKQVGYVACGVFLNEKDELLRLVINSVRTDLISRNEAFQCLALEFVANGKLLISLNSITKKHSSSACAVTLLGPSYGILFQFRFFFKRI